MRGLVCVLIVLLAFACNSGEDSVRTAMPAPSPSATPQATATPKLTAIVSPTVSSTVAQLAYIDGDGDMWLINADGSDKRSATEHTPVRCLRPLGLYWSPTGQWVACVGTGPVLTPQATLVIVDLQGKPLLQMEPKAQLGGFSWSPTGRDYAYVLALPDGTRQLYIEPIGAGGHTGATLEGVGEAFWSPDGSQVAYAKGPGDTLTIYDLASRQEKIIGDGLRPLTWVLGGTALLVASDYEEALSMFPTYTANLLDLATRELRRMPQLDNTAQFWPSPDGRTVAVFTHQAGAEIALLDLTTGAVTPIPGAIPHHTEWIPPDHLAFFPDGSHFFWADFLPIPNEGVRSVAIYRANTDGSGNAPVGQIESVEVRFSPDLTKVLYHSVVPDMQDSLWVANVDGSEAHLLAEDARPAAWRPTP
jgi:dipeptidyl aminopeptidase/acylaminoacyl peptidase